MQYFLGVEYFSEYAEMLRLLLANIAEKLYGLPVCRIAKCCAPKCRDLGVRTNEFITVEDVAQLDTPSGQS